MVHNLAEQTELKTADHLAAQRDNSKAGHSARSMAAHSDLHWVETKEHYLAAQTASQWAH